MKNLIILITIVLLFSSLPVYGLTDLESKTIYVDDDNIYGPWDGTIEHPFRKIKEAIDNADNGDTILVNSGSYSDYVDIDKSIQLIGQDQESTIISGFIEIAADSVVFSSFTIQKGSIWCHNADGVTITDNIISRHGEYGILIEYSNNDVISYNTISFFNVGILYVASSNNQIIGNNLESNGKGISDNLSPYLPSSNMITVSNNRFTNNSYAIAVWWTESLTFTGNVVSENDKGVYCILSFKPSKTTIKQNNFYDNNRDVYIIEDQDEKTNILIENNYWDRPRVLPKAIFGRIKYAYGFLSNYPWFFIDWHPASEPYDIDAENI